MKDGCHITMMHQIREFNSPVVLSSLSLQLPHPDGSYDNSIQRYKENQVLVQACVFQMVSSGCWLCNVRANFTSIIQQWREATFFAISAVKADDWLRITWKSMLHTYLKSEAKKGSRLRQSWKFWTSDNIFWFQIVTLAIAAFRTNQPLWNIFVCICIILHFFHMFGNSINLLIKPQTYLALWRHKVIKFAMTNLWIGCKGSVIGYLSEYGSHSTGWCTSCRASLTCSAKWKQSCSTCPT